MEIFGGKRFFIYGDGVSGRAAKQAIKKNGGKAKIYSDLGGAFVPPPDKHYDGAVISPGIKPTHAVYEYCARRGIDVFGEVDIGFSLAKCDIVGVTGTNGKTTVTRMIAGMTEGVACGNIGYPISLAVMKNPRVIVCELSSFQLHTSRVSPTVAVITNTSPDHIDWHGSAENYYADKCKIASGDKCKYLVLGEDVRVGALNGLKTNAQIVRTSTKSICDGAYVSDGYFCFNGERVCPTDYLRLPGEHNKRNALTAIAAAKCLGANNRAVLSALSQIEASPHRTETVGYACGKLWVDDSKGTNVSACRAAIDLYPDSICLIVGGRGKDTDFSELFIGLSDRVKSVIAMGETAQGIRDAACEHARGLKVTVVNKLADAVEAAASSNEKTVLLSPACASFDEFNSYAERGEKFAQLVGALVKREKTDGSRA